MVSTDPIADMLSRIRNAVMVNKSEVSMPYSRIKQSVAEILKKYGYITEVSASGDGVSKQLKIVINDGSSNARITEIARLSRPGRRMYAGSGKIPVVKQGRGMVIISTSKGVMSGDEAKKARIGGELICKVY